MSRISTASQIHPRGSVLEVEKGTLASFPVVSLLNQMMSLFDALDGAFNKT